LSDSWGSTVDLALPPASAIQNKLMTFMPTLMLYAPWEWKSRKSELDTVKIKNHESMGGIVDLLLL